MAHQILLSAIPCYGILRHQFISVTSIFFEKSCENEHDFTNFLLSVSNPTTGVLHREAGVQVSTIIFNRRRLAIATIHCWLSYYNYLFNVEVTDAMTSCLCFVISSLPLLQSYGDLPVMWLISRLGVEHVLGIVKLLMLEGRILLFSTHASKASCAVLALLSLVPGLYNQVCTYLTLQTDIATCSSNKSSFWSIIILLVLIPF